MTRCNLLVPLLAFISLLCLYRCQAIGTKRSVITLTDNGYEGILIAIENNVPEDPLLIERIKKHFSDASALMHRITKKRAYFGRIIILVPSTWTTGTYDAADKEDYSLANIVIHSDGSEFIPYTRQFEDCGKVGDQFFLHYDYIRAEKVTGGIAARLPHDKTIVHEWAHLRWGVFDEYPVDKEDAKFYLDSGVSSRNGLTAVKCGKHLKGQMGRGVSSRDGKLVPTGHCRINPNTFLPEDPCIFLPDYDDPGVTASLMYDINTPAITEFCDNDPIDHLTLHNSEAPNRQNKHCDGHSVWEVMRAHPDFSTDNGADGSTINTTPQFQVLRTTHTKLFLILDVSGSMYRGNKLRKLRQDATLFLSNSVAIGSYVGIITFNTTARIAHSITQINNSNDIDKLIEALPEEAGGKTCIGCGLNLALESLQALEEEGIGTQGTRFLLLCDGDETEPLDVRHVLPKILTKGITVDSFLYTKEAERDVVYLARVTGGMVFFDSGSSSSTALLNGFLTSVEQRQQPGLSSIPTQVLLRTIQIESQARARLSVALDGTVGKNTRFSFTYSSEPDEAPWLDVTVISPSGTVFSSSGSHATWKKKIGLLLFNIPETAEVGEWDVVIVNTQDTVAVTRLLVVSARADIDVASYSVTATIKHGDVDFQEMDQLELIRGDRVNPVVIYAVVTQAHTPVIRANVTAKFIGENYVRQLPLADNGLGSDLFKDDGTYSAYFTQLPSNGLYAAQIEVSSNDETATVTAQATSSSAPNTVYFPDIEAKNIEVKVPSLFQRSTSAGFISVANKPTRLSDLYPPSRVTDFRVVKTVYEEITISLKWTSVGDDLDYGQAQSYEIRYCTKINNIRHNFSECQRVEEEHVLSGSLVSPQPSQSEENIQLKLTHLQTNVTYYFGLRVWDDSNKVSKVSNIINIGLYEPEIIEPTEEVTELKASSTTPANCNVLVVPNYHLVWLLTLIVVVTLVSQN